MPILDFIQIAWIFYPDDLDLDFTHQSLLLEPISSELQTGCKNSLANFILKPQKQFKYIFTTFTLPQLNSTYYTIGIFWWDITIEHLGIL